MAIKKSGDNPYRFCPSIKPYGLGGSRRVQKSSTRKRSWGGGREGQSRGDSAGRDLSKKEGEKEESKGVGIIQMGGKASDD